MTTLSPVLEADHHDYLAGLNRSFPQWGEHRRLAWVLRPFGGQVPDIFAMRSGGSLRAGSIVSYRLVGHREAAHWVGIMTGSWTDVEFRGRGLFTQMVAHSAALVRNRGAIALLAFVTAGNASRRRLEAAGSMMIPTWYLSAPFADPPPREWAHTDRLDDSLASLDSQRSLAAGTRCRFIYPTIADLRCHLLDRSDDSRVVTSEGGEVAVVEQTGASLRVLATSGFGAQPYARGCIEQFRFTSDAAVAEAARQQGGSRVTDGFLTVLPVVDDWPAPLGWFIESGDRI